MARLKIRRNQNDYFTLELEEGKSYKIGRKDGCAVVLQPDPGISREHLEVYQNEFKQWVIKNLSPHLPITDIDGSYEILTCIRPTHEFSVSPYDFYLTQEFAPLETDAPPAENAGAAEDLAPPAQSEDKKDPNIDDELSFVGSEEKTSDVFLEGDPYLKFMYSSHSESIRLKGNRWTAGRDNIAQITLNDKKASRQHFSIEKVGHEFFIKDLKSANGTLLNGQELKPNEGVPLKSGDIITVNQLTMIFELRDLAFSEKLKDLPLQAYSGPMILTSQDWDSAAAAPPGVHGQLPARLSHQELAMLSGQVERLEKPKNVFRMVLIGVVAVVFVLAYFMNSTPTRKVAADPNLPKTFESLSPEEQKFVVNAYKMANSLYEADDAKVESALSQIESIHKIIPSYKDSKTLEVKFRQTLETIEQKRFVQEELKRQEENRKQVETIIADCTEKYKDSVDLEGAKDCLKVAQELDPENTDGQGLIAGIESRISQAQLEEQKLKEYNEAVARGRDMYYKARNLLQNNDYQEAMNAFSSHMNSSLPDPDNLKNASKRNLASIEKRISSQKNGFMGKARYNLQIGNTKAAILAAEQARLVDPYDYAIANFIEQHKTELQNRMRTVYTNSVIEERFGNVELSKNLWREIITKDVPNGEYYLKARRKLQQYGFQ